ncbi:hypothetical protein [Parvularcula sp. IMCC14364]|nr:hypothetical protein [Parvularcula sp. IMCC14364]
MKLYAGLDLSMASTEVCVVDESGKQVHTETIDSVPEVLIVTEN